MPTLRLLEARAAAAPAVPSYLYEFRWNSPTLPAGLGAFHALDLPFAHDSLAGLLATPGGQTWLGPNPPAELATSMHAAWVQFAKTGDPGWPAYELDQRRTMIFDSRNEVVADAAAPERQAWHGRR